MIKEIVEIIKSHCANLLLRTNNMLSSPCYKKYTGKHFSAEQTKKKGEKEPHPSYVPRGLRQKHTLKKKCESEKVCASQRTT